MRVGLLFRVDCLNYQKTDSYVSYAALTGTSTPEAGSEDNVVTEAWTMDLVRHIYRLCSWNLKRTYRIAGESVPGECLVNFDLAKALEVHEGRLKGKV